MTSITLKNVTKVYGTGASASRAVDDVSLAIETGEFFFLLGPSGCGKTTLLRIIAGLTPPTQGRVLFGDQDVTGLSVEQRRSPMVFQSYALWPHMTAARNVEFGPRMRGRGRSAARQTAEESLHMVRMTEFAKRKPNQLSGGQQQRVALARALAAEGDCLLLDEPLSNLDARLRLHMRDELRFLVKDTGVTAVYVTHDQKEALSMADRIAVMNEGRIAQTGGPEELYRRPATRFVADFLGEANFLAGRVLAAGAPARIETPAGTLLAAAAAPPEGTDATCCVRPERIAIAPSDTADTPPADGTLAARVLSTTYLGEIRQYTCAVGPARWKVSVLADRARPTEAGSEVLLRIAPEDITLLPD